MSTTLDSEFSTIEAFKGDVWTKHVQKIFVLETDWKEVECQGYCYFSDCHFAIVLPTGHCVLGKFSNEPPLVSVANQDINTYIQGGMEKGSYFVDHTTTSATVARKLAAFASNEGFAFLDGPVSGGQAGAENGALSIMLGGREMDFDVVRPVLEAYGKTIRLMVYMSSTDKGVMKRQCLRMRSTRRISHSPE